jgi:Cu-processing system permease protein
MNHSMIISIAKKEIMDNIRNKWIIILTIIFASLTIVASFFGSIFSKGWQDFGGTITSMMSLVQLLVPIIALVLGYAAIIGEIERGSMSALLSLQTTRLEIILGKFVGLACVLSFTILVGFGIAGLVIAANVASANFLDYTVFIGATILFGLVFLSLALFFSTVFKKRSTAIGGAILIWFFFNMILPLILSGILAANIGLEKLVAGEIPSWYYTIDLINPISVYSSLIYLNIKPVATFQQSFIPVNYPDFYSNGLMIGIFLLWIVVFIYLAYWKFNRRDI